MKTEQSQNSNLSSSSTIRLPSATRSELRRCSAETAFHSRADCNDALPSVLMPVSRVEYRRNSVYIQLEIYQVQAASERMSFTRLRSAMNSGPKRGYTGDRQDATADWV
jgi:hypothetical protein